MVTDDTLRSLATKHANEASKVASLVSKPENELYALLAARTSERIGIVGSSDDKFRTAYNRDDLMRGPPSELGKRIFMRCSRAAHDFCCSPSDEDRNLQNQMLNAIFSKDGGGVALLAGGLVAAFGLSPAIAAVVAALLVKIVVAPTAQELCAAWGATLKS